MPKAPPRRRASLEVAFSQLDLNLRQHADIERRIVLATLIGEACEPLRRRDYEAMRCLCGVAPVNRQSGKSRRVTRRLACSHRLRNAVHHWAAVAVRHDELNKVHNMQQGEV